MRHDFSPAIASQEEGQGWSLVFRSKGRARSNVKAGTGQMVTKRCCPDEVALQSMWACCAPASVLGMYLICNPYLTRWTNHADQTLHRQDPVSPMAQNDGHSNGTLYCQDQAANWRRSAGGG